ncbi:MAG: hypothetical protein ISS28_02225 [Candidatus Cloacimonetes bacterium]|nr:hypothetical protein [Candidatus Cloacimonadota bacterium]
MLKIVKNPISKLLLNCLIVSLIIPFFTSSTNILIAQDRKYEDDETIKKEAQEQLAAMLQWSARYRFGKDLKVGDRVEYKLIGDGKNNTEVELEVTKEEKGGVWIVEKFEGNEVHMLVDLKTMTLLDLFGYDEEGRREEPPLLDDGKVLDTIEEMKNMANAMGETGIPIGWDNANAKSGETITTTVGPLSCAYLEPQFSEEITKNMNSDKIVEIKEAMKLYFSEDIPKLLPFEIAMPAIVAPENFEIIKGGFVKNIDLEIKDYCK